MIILINDYEFDLLRDTLIYSSYLIVNWTKDRNSVSLRFID